MQKKSINQLPPNLRKQSVSREIYGSITCFLTHLRDYWWRTLNIRYSRSWGTTRTTRDIDEKGWEISDRGRKGGWQSRWNHAIMEFVARRISQMLSTLTRDRTGNYRGETLRCRWHIRRIHRPQNSRRISYYETWNRFE